MRIAMLPTPDLRCETGSTVHALLVAERLAAAGHDVHVFAKSHPDGTAGTTFHDLPLRLVHPALVDRPISDGELWECINLLSAAVLRKHACARFDLVHAHYATVTGFAALTTNVISGIPFAVSCFGRDLNIGARYDRRYERMVRLVVARAKAVIAADDGIHEILARDYQVDGPRLFTVPMGLDEELFCANSAHVATARPLGQRPRVVNVSSCFAPEKGLDVLLRAVKEVRNSGLEVAVVIAGDDDHEDKVHLRHLNDILTDLCLEDAVTLPGRVSHRDIPGLLASSDVFVDTRTVGNFSSATLEALFAAPCVVASDVPGNRRWIECGRNGLLFHSGDSDDLACKLSRVLRDEQLRRSLQDGRRDWQNREGFKWGAATMIDRLIEIYGEIR